MSWRLRSTLNDDLLLSPSPRVATRPATSAAPMDHAATCFRSRIQRHAFKPSALTPARSAAKPSCDKQVGGNAAAGQCLLRSVPHGGLLVTMSHGSTASRCIGVCGRRPTNACTEARQANFSSLLLGNMPRPVMLGVMRLALFCSELRMHQIHRKRPANRLLRSISSTPDRLET